jgi:hypothetical protein
VPEGAAVLAVGGGAEPDRLLLADRLGDMGVLDGAQGGGVDPAGGVVGAGGAQGGGTQQAAGARARAVMAGSSSGRLVAGGAAAVKARLNRGAAAR